MGPGKEMEKSVKEHLLKSVKIAVAALLSLFIAGELGLKYSATAGIITVLSIGNTKRETLKSAANRGMAYVCALILAAVCFRGLGYTLPAFAVYLFFFAFVCMAADWREAITTDSVLITHFLNEGNMGPQMMVNETLLFVIGAGVGILVNLHLHSKEADFEKLADEVDERIKEILRRMAEWLRSLNEGEACDGSISDGIKTWSCGGEMFADCGEVNSDENRHGMYENEHGVGNQCFPDLEDTIRRAKLCAAANYNNSLFREDTYQLDYIRMREQQTVVLKGICQNIERIDYLPKQAVKVAALFRDVEQAYHKYNTVEGLLARLQELLEEMKQEKLPESRAEFEARAILFYILVQMEELLMIKRRFVESRGNVRVVE